LLRVAADFDNYKKRAAREREQYVALANERFVKELLPVLDDLERALDAGEEQRSRRECDSCTARSRRCSSATA